MLYLNNIQTSYVNGPSFHYHARFDAGKIYGLIGPSGCGKSTLLDILMGFCPIKCGQIRWHETRLDVLHPHERNMHYIAQSGHLIEHLCVHEHIQKWCRAIDRLGVNKNYAQNTHPSSQKIDVDALLDMLELSDQKHQRINNLSGGQKQRLSLMQLYLWEKPIILLDEPLTGLAPTQRRFIQQQITKQKSENNVIIMTSHHINEITDICDECIFVYDGQMMDILPIHDIHIDNASNLSPLLTGYLGW